MVILQIMKILDILVSDPREEIVASSLVCDLNLNNAFHLIFNHLYPYVPTYK